MTIHPAVAVFGMLVAVGVIVLIGTLMGLALRDFADAWRTDHRPRMRGGVRVWGRRWAPTPHRGA